MLAQRIDKIGLGWCFKCSGIQGMDSSAVLSSSIRISTRFSKANNADVEAADQTARWAVRSNDLSGSHRS